MLTYVILHTWQLQVDCNSRKIDGTNLRKTSQAWFFASSSLALAGNFPFHHDAAERVGD
jgi:hypothetical protein